MLRCVYSDLNHPTHTVWREPLAVHHMPVLPGRIASPDDRARLVPWTEDSLRSSAPLPPSRQVPAWRNMTALAPVAGEVPSRAVSPEPPAVTVSESSDDDESASPPVVRTAGASSASAASSGPSVDLMASLLRPALPRSSLGAAPASGAAAAAAAGPAARVGYGETVADRLEFVRDALTHCIKTYQRVNMWLIDHGKLELQHTPSAYCCSALVRTVWDADIAATWTALLKRYYPARYAAATPQWGMLDPAYRPRSRRADRQASRPRPVGYRFPAHPDGRDWMSPTDREIDIAFGGRPF